jgi:hypothetical protein
MKVSKNCDKGEKIETIVELQNLVKNKKAVYNGKLKKVQPASVIISQSVRNVQSLIDNNKLFKIIKRK